MKPETAQAILVHVQQHNVPARMNVATAEGVIRAWLRALGWQQDRYGNFINPENDKDRYHFSKQNLQHQAKDGEWRNYKSLSMIDAANNLIRASAQLTGDQGVLAKFLAAKEARKAEGEKRAQQAATDRQRKQAYELAMKDFASTHRRKVLDWKLGKLSQDAFEKLRGEFDPSMQKWLEHVTSGAAEPGDELFASADNPPILPVVDQYGEYEYSWTETVDGVPYTVWIHTATKGQEAEIQIGQSATTGLQVSAISHQLSMSHRDAKGDAYITGRVFQKNGKFGASLFLIISGEKKKGAGTRVMSIWCRLMRGYGVERWVAQAVGPEGAAFMQAMDKKGMLHLENTEGAHWVVSCPEANPARKPAPPPFDEQRAYARAIEKYVESLPEGTWARIIVVANPWPASVHEVRRYSSSKEAHEDKKRNNTGGTLVHKPKPFPKCPEWLSEDLRNPAAPRTTFSSKEAADAAVILGVDFAEAPFDLEQFRRGMVVELEHGLRDPKTNVTNDTLLVTAMIALAHLNEIPDYYYRLAAMETEGKRAKRDPKQKPRVSIRHTTIRHAYSPDEQGFLVSGTAADGRPFKIATSDRAKAEAIRDEFKAAKPGYGHRAQEILLGKRIDTYYANPARPERVVIENGMLISFVYPAFHLALERYRDAPVSFWLKFQLFDADTGKPSTGDYRGPGTIVDRDGKRYLLLGDPSRQAYLSEYVIADEATPESIKALDEFEAGVKAAIGEFKPGRRVKSKGENWLDGYDQAIQYRKLVDSGKQNPARKDPQLDALDAAVLQAVTKIGGGTVVQAIWDYVLDRTGLQWKLSNGKLGVPLPKDISNSLKRLQYRGLVYAHDGNGQLAVWHGGGKPCRYWSTRETIKADYGYSDEELPTGK